MDTLLTLCVARHTARVRRDVDRAWTPPKPLTYAEALFGVMTRSWPPAPAILSTMVLVAVLITCVSRGAKGT